MFRNKKTYRRTKLTKAFSSNFDWYHAMRAGAHIHMTKVEPRCNEPLYRSFVITNDFFTPVIIKYMEQSTVIENIFC